MPYLHYTSLEGLKGIIETKSMWASHINFLNDRKEWLHFDDIVHEALQTLKYPIHIGEKTYTASEELLKDLSAYRGGRINEFSFVISFSSTRDCKSQWVEYCPKLSGYALEFSESPIIKHQDGARKMYTTSADESALVECVYERDLQVNRICEVISSITRGKPDDRYLISKLSCELHDLRYQFKHPGFKEEKEYRWYGRYDSQMDIRTRNGIMVPYVKVNIDITKLSAIWVGPSPVQDRAAEGLGFWWSVLQKKDSSYIYKNKETGILKIQKSQIPYSYL